MTDEQIEQVADSLARSLLTRARQILDNGSDVEDYRAADRIENGATISERKNHDWVLSKNLAESPSAPRRQENAVLEAVPVGNVFCRGVRGIAVAAVGQNINEVR